LANEINFDDKQYNIELCLKCGKDATGLKECECGSKRIVFGEKFTLTDDKAILCDCGNNELTMKSHFNLRICHNYTWQCTKCYNQIGVQSFKTKDQMEMEDEE
jgi:hypothetical protein